MSTSRSNLRHAVLILAASLIPLSACEERPKTPPANGLAKPVAALPAGFFLASAPADAKTVEQIKGTAKPGDSVTIQGRIGGSESPFVEGRAVFTIIGPGIPACSDNPDDHCKIPWDYCCETPEDIASHSATIQIVDDKGALLRTSLKGQSGIKELSDLIVVGKVAQAEDKVLVVHATGVYVAKQ